MINKFLRLKLLRHGSMTTGGAQYEHELLRQLSEALDSKGIKNTAEQSMLPGIFKGIQHVSLLSFAYQSADGDVNIAVARMALPALLRNLTGKRKTIIVFHHYDENYHSKYLKLYYSLLFRFLRSMKNQRAVIVTVSPYFEEYFERRSGKVPVYRVPNLFDTSFYLAKRRGRNPAKVILGQYSPKNSPVIFELAQALTAQGFECIFLTPDPALQEVTRNYAVKHLSQAEYLNEIAGANFTLALSALNEGWNRMAHESILLGTPVIGFDKGGLGDLLRESGSYIINSAPEVLEMVSPEKLLPYNAPADFIKKYDSSNFSLYLQPLVDFINA